MTTLSKSRFISGVQCSKKLYLEVNRPDLGTEPDAGQLARFETGHKIGELAKRLFPGGIDLTPAVPREYGPAIAGTIECLGKGETTLYEAAFAVDGAFAALDILHHNNGERWAIEVKSSTECKDYHIWDCSFQYWVMTAAGYRPDRMFLMHVNKNYRLHGEIDPAGLFTRFDITDEVVKRQAWAEAEATRLRLQLESDSVPPLDIGPHCKAPFSCQFIDHCWAHIPSPSVFDLYKGGAASHRLYAEGVLRLDDIRDDHKLSPIQRIQVESNLYDRPYYDTSQLQDFLDKLQAPLHFFDFESISPAIPLVQGTGPYNQIPFQYSLHVADGDGNLIDHHEYLSDPLDFIKHAGSEDDPRRPMIAAMKTHFHSHGTILVYNQSFELGRLREMAAAFPEDASFLTGLMDRIVDLLVPFRKGWCYLPAMGGSFSIKSVLPAIAPEFAYDDLTIQDGTTASETFLRLINDPLKRQEPEIIADLLSYCKRDTEGMIPVYRHLKELI